MRLNRNRVRRQRAHLDAKLASAGVDSLGRIVSPRLGWLKAVRESLGMSAEQLATRLGVTKQSVLSLERNETRGTASLKSLDRAASALGCRLAYALIPDQSIEAMVDARALAVARQKLERVGHTMALEAQAPPSDLHELEVRELARELKEKLSADLWNDR
jgi:predicted DNA-binding mobile mystery protein A